MNARTLKLMARKVLSAKALPTYYQQLADILRTVNTTKGTNLASKIENARRSAEISASQFDVSQMTPAELKAYRTIDPSGRTGPDGQAWLIRCLQNSVGSPGVGAEEIAQRAAELSNVMALAENVSRSLGDIEENEGKPVVTIWLAGDGTPTTLNQLKDQISDWASIIKAFGRLTQEDSDVDLIGVDEGSVGLEIAFKAIMLLTAILSSTNSVLNITARWRERRAAMAKAIPETAGRELRESALEVVDAERAQSLKTHVDDIMENYNGAEEKNELNNVLVAAVTRMGNRLEQGHRLSIRGGDNDELSTYMRELDAATRKLRELPAVGEILSLPEASSDNTSGDQDRP